jgi:Histidine kinase-, DNA gyrase B-, and HSP90-like ATPase
MMTIADDEIPTTGTTYLPPDPAVMDIVGHNHALPTAVADLVDNSIDARAATVLVRLVRRGERVVRIYVVDDGQGIPPDEIDHAMTVAARRSYNSGDLGQYGLGLKGASFSQANSLTLVSRSKDASAVGRRWLLEKARTGFECDVVAEDFCVRELDTSWAGLVLDTGTVVRLDRLRQAPAGAETAVHKQYVVKAVDGLRRHLGMVFHRFLGDGRLGILIEVTDENAPEVSVPMRVTALDPFDYRVTGAKGYPQELVATSGHERFSLECHIWTPRSELVNFKMGTLSATAFSGFYFYRADRLLQTGGWNGVTAQATDTQLARVRIEVTSSYERHLRVTPQKTGVECDEQLIRALENALSKDGQTTFALYLDEARRVRKDSHRRGDSSRRRRIEPGKGFAPVLRRSIARAFEYVSGEEPISIRWCRFDDDSFLAVDRETQTVWLNETYRAGLNRGGQGSLNDAPLLKAMLYLLSEDLFQGSFMGSKDREHLATLQEVLTVAAKAEFE